MRREKYNFLSFLLADCAKKWDFYCFSSCLLWTSCRVFRTLKIVSGERNGRKILEKIQGVLLTWTYRRVIKVWILCPRRSRIACFSVKTTFFQKKTSFLEKGANEKFWKKFQKFLSIVSIDSVSFKNSHWNHHKWENKTKIAPWKSADVGLFYGPQLSESSHRFFSQETFCFCRTVLRIKSYV